MGGKRSKLEDIVQRTFSLQDIRLNSKRAKTTPMPDIVRKNMSENKMQVTAGENPIKLYLPLIGAAMDTVTAGFDVRPKYNGGLNFDAAIIYAQEGAIAAVPRSVNIGLKEQEKIIKGIKRATSFIVRNPYTVGFNDTLEVVQGLQEEYGYSGYPVIDENGVVVGIITKRDFENRDPEMSISKRMTKNPHVVLESDLKTIEDADTVLDEYKHSRLPVVNKEGKLVGLLTRDDVDNRRFHPDATLDEFNRYRVLVAVGTDKEEEELKRLSLADGFVVDASVGRSEKIIEKIEWLKKNTDKPVIGGNTMGYEDTLAVLEVADAGKIGYGIGGACISSEVTGIGDGMANMLKNASYASLDAKKPIWGDGSCKNSGDIPPAIGLGAHAYMIGQIFAHAIEAPVVEFRDIKGFPEKIYRGMGSSPLIQGSHRYTSKVSEGVEKWIKIKGPLSGILIDFEKGVWSGISGLGFESWQEMIGSPDLIFNIKEKTDVSGDLKTIPEHWNVNIE